MLASSELDFDFDDIVVNSVAYRRVLSAAKQEISTPKYEVPAGDLIDFSDDATLRQQTVCIPDLEGLGLSEDLLGLRFEVSVHNPPTPRICCPCLMCTSADTTAQTEKQPTSQASVVPLEQPETGVSHPVHSSIEKLPQALREPSPPNVSSLPADEHMSPSLEQNDSKEESRYKPYRDGVLAAAKPPKRKLSWGPADDQAFRVAQSNTLSTKSDGSPRSPTAGKFCCKCESVLTGQFVRALGGLYHLACFTCEVCSLSFSQSLCADLFVGLRLGCREEVLPD